MALQLESSRAQHLTDTASRSTAEARALEDDDTESFDDYRRRHIGLV